MSDLPEQDRQAAMVLLFLDEVADSTPDRAGEDDEQNKDRNRDHEIRQERDRAVDDALAAFPRVRQIDGHDFQIGSLHHSARSKCGGDFVEACDPPVRLAMSVADRSVGQHTAMFGLWAEKTP